MKRITRLRLDKGWSKSELARQAAIHPSQVGLIESGRFVPYKSQLAKLAAALGVDGSVDLLADVDPEPARIAQ